ncbi:MAG TPA: hypothetical protein VHK24_05550, partial [Steroidobacter sp.]|nr:hypothetical protein [Steroidobacter sp.]
MSNSIVIRGARQNNLKNIDLELPTNELIVVTGVSGSGKSSLVFDTLYAEGQRRYVETFSPYARQFLDRMDRPQVDRIEGIPPAIAIDQTNPVRTSRSTVGTMTELNDHLKLLYARAAQLYCRGCAAPVKRHTAQSVWSEVSERLAPRGSDVRVIVTFPVTVPHNFSEAEVLSLLEKQGYTRVFQRSVRESNDAGGAPPKKAGARRPRETAPQIVLEMIQDRVRWSEDNRQRIIEALESALRVGQGRVGVHIAAQAEAVAGLCSAVGHSPPGAYEAGVSSPLIAAVWRFSCDLQCADCDIHYQEPTPSLFSFNSPLGACETCRGFGRTIGIDFGLVVPDESKTLSGGAVRPWQTESYRECQDDLLKFARKRGIPIDTPWSALTEEQKRWVLEGEGSWEEKRWYGVRRFFAWLETKSYKMHIRVLLSKYRAYTPCPACAGARLKTDALLWRLGARADADATLQPHERFRPSGTRWSHEGLQRLPGVSLHELMLLPIERCRAFFERLSLPAPLDEASDLVLREIRSRLGFLLDVGLGYLTLDRQSRTLSGGEVQRINLTTALGTSLVNTLFVLDEPSIGLHPRDIGRVVNVMRRLKEAGNSLVVVEHDPQVMQAADRIIDVGPGPGERGGQIVFYGKPDELVRARNSLTADYLLGRRSVSRRRSNGGDDHGRADARSAARASFAALMSEGPQRNDPWLGVRGAREHNLKGIDVSIPLHKLVCVTGVSGSGKSTLIQDVLHPALLKRFGKATETPGAHDSIEGVEHIGGVVLVDQAPIGRTARSNPASYVGAFDAIRKLFAAEPLARERGYTIGTFSFNSGAGRCPTCSGNGFERVEMQFLSDVYLRCPDCNARRYRPEILEITLHRAGGPGRSIADVLEMTVAEALLFFQTEPQVLAALMPLVEVGLDYLRLGQPVPTLSGGEAQRLKLAGHLAAAAADHSRTASGALFLFDEPTTGLHFEDIEKLLGAFQRLIQSGHSVLVIEHNLDVIAAADWIIDLGPEGGETGGQLVCAGAPADVMRCAASHTGRALREADGPCGIFASDGRPFAVAPRTLSGGVSDGPVVASQLSRGADASASIRIHGAREHNLKDIDVELPRNRFTVVTGVSGSGKSTLAFD